MASKLPVYFAILIISATGGGHAWFESFKGFLNVVKGTKSMFPAGWSSEKIMYAVSEVTVNNNWVQQTGKLGAWVTKSGQPVRYIVEGTYQGVKMIVVTTANEIITAFPIK